jgi:hypothetical protein
LDAVVPDRLMSGIWLTLSGAAGMGVVTMVVVQLLKDLLPVRRVWQRWWIQSVVRQQAAKVNANPTQVLGDLINLATAGNARALYDLPVERLGGQFNAAAQVVLDFPARHTDLLRVLAAGADSADVQTLLTQRPQALTLAAAPATAVPAAPANPQQNQALVGFVDARNRVANQVQRNLDALQIAMGFRWKLILQIFSLAVGVACAVAIARVWTGPADERASMPGSMVVGILAGFFSTVARDLLAVLENLRGRG